MTVFVDAARIIVSLGSLGNQFTGVGDSKYSGEYLGASVTSMAADLLAIRASAGNVKDALKFAPQTKVRFADEVQVVRPDSSHYRPGRHRQSQRFEGTRRSDEGASIILTTLSIVEFLEVLIGFGPPDEGESFKAASEQLTAVAQGLTSAVPADWEGSGSQGYGAQNTAQQDLALAIADLDLQLAAAVKDQAAWVAHIRLGFGLLKDLLFAAYIVEITVNPLPAPGGPLFGATFAMKVCVLGIAAVVGMLGTLLICSRSNAAKANDLADRYRELDPEPGATDTTAAGAEVAAAEEPTVPSFEAISRSMSPMSVMPDIATLAGIASRSGDDETSVEPETPASTTQVAKASVQASRRMNVVASTAQQGRAVAPAKKAPAKGPVEEAAAEEDVEAAGVASGTGVAPAGVTLYPTGARHFAH